MQNLDFMQVLTSRHSVRDFLPDPIPREALDAILEAGRLAPSAQNRQPWRYLVFTDPEKIRQLNKNTGLIGLSNYLIIKDAPCLIIACADSSKSVSVNKHDYYLVDVAISFQQMILTAWSHGIGSCWMAAFNERPLAKYLELPKGWRIVAMSPFGYPKDEKGMYTKLLDKFSKAEIRKPIEEIVIFK